MGVRLWSIAVMMLMLAAVSSVRAGQSRIIGDPSRDVRQTMQARKLLADDPELAQFNIGVNVTDRVAVLWGPVPMAEAAFRAELCLRTMIELAEVRNELFVREPLEPSRVPLKIDNPPQFLPDLLPPSLPEQPRPIFGAPGFLMGQDKSEAKKLGSQTTPTLENPSSKVKVMAPPPAPKLEKPQLEEVGKKSAEPSGMTEADRELATAIRNLLQSKSAYSPVQFAVKDGRVYLRATNEDSDVLHEAARAVARLPNVDGVILLEKTSPR
jgi:osmotically-inducible protein OsmY